MEQPLARIRAQDNGTERVDPDGARHRELLSKRGNGRLALWPDRITHGRLEPGPKDRVIALRDVRWVGVTGRHNSRATWPQRFLLVAYRDAVGTERIAGFRMGRAHAERWRDALEEAARRAGAPLIPPPA